MATNTPPTVDTIKDSCDILDVPLSDASNPSKVKKAYHKKSLKCHPDKGGDKEEFQRVSMAFQCINKNPNLVRQAQQHFTAAQPRQDGAQARRRQEEVRRRQQRQQEETRRREREANASREREEKARREREAREALEAQVRREREEQEAREAKARREQEEKEKAQASEDDMDYEIQLDNVNEFVLRTQQEAQALVNQHKAHLDRQWDSELHEVKQKLERDALVRELDRQRVWDSKLHELEEAKAQLEKDAAMARQLQQDAATLTRQANQQISQANRTQQQAEDQIAQVHQERDLLQQRHRHLDQSEQEQQCHSSGTWTATWTWAKNQAQSQPDLCTLVCVLIGLILVIKCCM